MTHIRVNAPAKLNLHLHIGGRRPDGFHDLESLFIALAFGDALSIETVPEPLSLEINMDWQVQPGESRAYIPSIENNIVSKAVSLFRSRSGYDEGLKITVEKRIPLGGGLGGGSSDAAATLLALNHLANGMVADAILAEMGATLGSDVPFFLNRSAAAWVSGRGEHIQPLELPESMKNLSFVLVNPGFPSDTAEAYRLLDCRRRERAVGLFTGTNTLSSCSIPHSPHDWPFFNDFLPVFLNETGKPDASHGAGLSYRRIIAMLNELGADFAGLSGSGSTCFGVFQERPKAESAQNVLLKCWPFVIDTRNECYDPACTVMSE